MKGCNLTLNWLAWCYTSWHSLLYSCEPDLNLQISLQTTASYFYLFLMTKVKQIWKNFYYCLQFYFLAYFFSIFCISSRIILELKWEDEIPLRITLEYSRDAVSWEESSMTFRSFWVVKSALGLFWRQC